MRLSRALGVVAVAMGCAACGGATTSGRPPVASASISNPTPASAEEQLRRALEVFAEHDSDGDWNDAVCVDMARRFAAAAERASGPFPEALFNEGLSLQRCGSDREARAKFEGALAADPKFHHARVQIALYQYAVDSNVDAAIAALQRAVHDASFQNVAALVNLARFQMLRDSAATDESCTSDMDCARLNLQRALAIEDSYMPAFNQLALYYLKQAKKRAGAGKRPDVQQLELAILVCSQALRKNEAYAPIHNTAGLIQTELGQSNAALASFGAATRLNPKFFEGQMNLGAANVSIRGFEKAEQAYRKALALRPNDYDAHLGLALALRGQITPANYDAQLAAVQAELDVAKRLDANRLDASFNEALLTQDYRTKGGDKAHTIATLEQAKGIYQRFIDQAANKPQYATAVTKAKERIEDIATTLEFLK